MHRALFVTSFLLTSTILSSHATAPVGNITEAEKEFLRLSQYRSFPSKLNFEVLANQTGAGILHYAEGADGPYILLGLRDDENSWCNLGGMSDADESGTEPLKTKKSQIVGLLAETAAREVEEESNGYFAHHPHDVRNLPFIDTLNERNGAAFLYRMYFKKVPLVAAEHLKKAQEESSNYHNQEYRDFKWVPAKKIWEAIFKNNQNVDLDEEGLTLFAPLFQTLRTPAGQALLANIAAFSKISRFSKDVRPLLNRVYDVRSQATEDYSDTFHWPDPLKIKDRPDNPIQSESDQAQLAYAVAAHGAAMTEIKSKFKWMPEKDPIDEIPIFTSWNEGANLSLSQIQLRMVLGPDYKTAADFRGQEKPERFAKKANIEEYLKRYAGSDEMKNRAVTYTDHDVEVLANILEWEEQHKNKPTFYHAANAVINNLWQSFTFLRELLSMTPLVGNKIMMRGTDIYFKDVKTMFDILEKYGYGDYQGRELLVLCANYVLMAGLQTTSTSSSSIEYLFNDHSVNAPNIEGRFEEATALAGIIARYAYFKSHFLQYLAHQNSSYPNSVMVGISVPSHLLTAHAYAAYGGGSQYTIRSPYLQPQAEPTVIGILKGIQKRATDPIEAFEENKQQKKELIPEARLNLHPDFILHPEVEMKAFNRFPLKESKQKEFYQGMRNTTIATLADWLMSQYKVMPDSFQDYPILKRLFNYVWKGVTREDPKERFAYESFTHLLNNEHIEGARTFLAKFPDVVHQESFEPRMIAQSLIRGNHLKSLKFLLDEIVRQSVQDFFSTPQEFYKAIRTCFMNNAYELLDYLLSNYDVKFISSDIVEAWSQQNDCNLLFILTKYFPELKTKAIQKVSSGNVEEYIQFSGNTPIETLKEILHNKSWDRYDLSRFIKKFDMDLGTLEFSNVYTAVKILIVGNNYSILDDLDLLIQKNINSQHLATAIMMVINSNSASHNHHNLCKYLAKLLKDKKLNLEDIQGLYQTELVINSIIALFSSSYSSSDDFEQEMAQIPILPQTIAQAIVKIISSNLVNHEPHKLCRYLIQLIEDKKLNPKNIQGLDQPEFVENFIIALLPIDPSYSTVAFEKLATRLPVSPESVAQAIVKVISSNLVSRDLHKLCKYLIQLIRDKKLNPKNIQGLDRPEFVENFIIGLLQNSYFNDAFEREMTQLPVSPKAIAEAIVKIISSNLVNHEPHKLCKYLIQFIEDKKLNPKNIQGLDQPEFVENFIIALLPIDPSYSTLVFERVATQLPVSSKSVAQAIVKIINSNLASRDSHKLCKYLIQLIKDEKLNTKDIQGLDRPAFVENFIIALLVQDNPDLYTLKKMAPLIASPKSVAQAIVRIIRSGSTSNKRLYGNLADWIIDNDLNPQDIQGLDHPEFLESFITVALSSYNGDPLLSNVYMVELLENWEGKKETISKMMVHCMQLPESHDFSVFFAYFFKHREIQLNTVLGFDLEWVFKKEDQYTFSRFKDFLGGLINLGIPTSEIFNALVKTRIGDTQRITDFAKKHSNDLIDVLTENERTLLSDLKEDDFMASIKTRYQTFDTKQAPEIPTAIAAREPSMVNPEINSGDLPFTPVANTEERQRTSPTTAAPDVSALQGDQLFAEILNCKISLYECLKIFFGNDIDRLKAEVRNVKDPKLLRDTLAFIIAADDYELMQATLQKAYPQTSDFMSVTELKFGYRDLDSPLSLATTESTIVMGSPFFNSAKAILDYLGDQLPSYLMSFLKNPRFNFIGLVKYLSQNNPNKLRNLWTQYQDLFLYHDEDRDRFSESLNGLIETKTPLIEEFVRSYKEKLRQLNLVGIPYFWYVFFSTDQILKFVEENLSLLELTSVDGLSPKDYIIDVLNSPQLYEKGMKQIQGKQQKRI